MKKEEAGVQGEEMEHHPHSILLRAALYCRRSRLELPCLLISLLHEPHLQQWWLALGHCSHGP